jgi:hypothetical protein
MKRRENHMRIQIGTRFGGVVRAAKVVAAVAAVVVTLGAMHISGGEAIAGPTCSNSGLNVDRHGDHVIRDYVIGEDGTGPEHEGAEIPGGPGPGFHFVDEPPGPFAPGASFCLTQAHPNGFTPPENVPSPGQR